MNETPMMQAETRAELRCGEHTARLSSRPATELEYPGQALSGTELPLGRITEEALPNTGVVLNGRELGRSKPKSMWALTVPERRAIWLRRKHPKMNASQRERWAQNAEPACSSR